MNSVLVCKEYVLLRSNIPIIVHVESPSLITKNNQYCFHLTLLSSSLVPLTPPLLPGEALYIPKSRLSGLHMYITRPGTCAVSLLLLAPPPRRANACLQRPSWPLPS